MHVTLVIDDIPFEVWLEREGDTVTVEVDDTTHTFEAARDGDAVLLEAEGADRGSMVEVPEVGLMRIDGQVARVRVDHYSPHGGPGHHGGPGAAGGPVPTPMPGKIVKLHREAGATVEAGDIVLVLEAMKMQVEVKAPAAGTLTKVNVAEGDTVDANQVLFVVEPADDPDA